MVLAVTGITGHTGRLFLKELEKHQYEGIVRCLVRQSSNQELIDYSSLHIEKTVGDVNSYDDLLSFTENANAVMHIYNIHNSVDVINACIENQVPRAVMVHTTGVYSKFKMASAEYKEIEAKVERILQSSDIDVTILRPTMIFGDLCDRNISRFIRMVDKYPFMPEIAKGSGKIRPVNARDLAKAFYTVVMTSNLPELYYDLSGDRSISLHELFDLIGKFLGKSVHHFSCPMWLGVCFAKAIKEVSAGKIDYIERVLRMSEDRDYGHELATRDFGYQPEAFDVGLKREVYEYIREKGSINDR